ncbi:TPA: restriction endonuclease subunit S [Vibrio parahaemolyticus]|nr:restriction endonuclease subunit S [Vibrio parahaemolyticus]HCG5559503.1 restriction endonuclease subunit S [Vibrio parahaemolyticus]
MSDIVPAGWGVSTILELGSNHKDCVQTGPFGAQLHAEDYVDEGIPLILIRNIKESGLDTRGMPKITEEDAERLSRYRLKIGDIVFSRVGRVGSCFLTTPNEEGWVISGQTLRMRTSNALIEPEYLLHALRAEKVQMDIVGESVGSTRTSINTNILENLEVNVPPLPEQKKIAAILTSVDDVIEKTQAQIDKLKDLKTGMMQELLTRGVSVDGKPHTDFKDSPVGRIPKGWACERLESLLVVGKNSMRSGPFGSALLKHELVPKGHPYLGIDNVHVERFEKKYKRFVSDEKFEQLKRYKVNESDVMITIMGTVGRSCVVPKGIGKALSSKHVWTMSFDQNKYIPELVCWQLNYSEWVKAQFKNESQGGVMESISSKTLKELWLPVPPISEQMKIREVHMSLSNLIREKERTLAKKVALKKALMQDLLTGKVRVKVED